MPRSLLLVVLLALEACKGATDVGGESKPSLSIADVTVTEGTGGTVDAVFAVTLSESSASAVTVRYATADGTASSPYDFAASSGTLTIASGTTSGEIVVAVVPDIVGEDASETFTVALSSPTDATVEDGTAIGTITDDDDCRPTATLALGQTVSGALADTDCVWTSPTDYFDMYLVSLPDSVTISVDLTSNAQEVDPYLAVLALDGSDDAQDDDGGYDANAHEVLSLPAGRFVVYAAASTPSGETGSYKLSVTRIPPVAVFYGSTGAPTSELYTIDPGSGAASPVGSIGFDNVGAMAFHPTTEVLYAEGARASDAVRVLISIDRSTGVGTEIGPTGAADATGLSFRADGTLFMYANDHNVYTVSTGTGAATLLGPSGYPMNGGNGIAFSASGTLYHSNRDESHTLDTSTGVGTFVADMDFPTPCATSVTNLNGGRFSGVDRAVGFPEFYGVVKCVPGSADPATHFGRVDFTTGYAIVIGRTQDRMDGFAVYSP